MGLEHVRVEVDQVLMAPERVRMTTPLPYGRTNAPADGVGSRADGIAIC